MTDRSYSIRDWVKDNGIATTESIVKGYSVWAVREPIL